jgi:hypothetical protein
MVKVIEKDTKTFFCTLAPSSRKDCHIGDYIGYDQNAFTYVLVSQPHAAFLYLDFEVSHCCLQSGFRSIMHAGLPEFS